MRAMFFASVLGVMACSALVPVAQADDPQATKSGASLKGDPKKITDLTVTPVKAGALPCVFWADAKGTAFYTISASGAIRRISYPELKEEILADLQTKSAYMSPSAEGLVVTVADSQEVLLLDAATFKIKVKLPVPGLTRAVSAYPLSMAVAVNKTDIYELDLNKKTVKKFAGEKWGGPEYPAMTPDGKSFFVVGRETLQRYAVVNGQVKYMEKTGRIGGSAIQLPQVSSDSKYACLGTYTGYNGGLPVFRASDIQSPDFVVKPAVAVAGFDSVGGFVYGQHPRGPFRLYSMKGELIKEYQIDPGDPKQILVHPDGKKLLYVAADRFYSIEVAK